MAQIVGGTIKVNPFNLDSTASGLNALGAAVTEASAAVLSVSEDAAGDAGVVSAILQLELSLAQQLDQLGSDLQTMAQRLNEASAAYRHADASAIGGANPTSAVPHSHNLQ